jgi:hypothetical protein
MSATVYFIHQAVGLITRPLIETQFSRARSRIYHGALNCGRRLKRRTALESSLYVRCGGGSSHSPSAIAFMSSRPNSTFPAKNYGLPAPRIREKPIQATEMQGVFRWM